VLEWTRDSARAARFCRLALDNGSPGLVMAPNGQLIRALAFTLAGDTITSIDAFANPAHLSQVDIAILEPVVADHSINENGEAGNV